VSNLFQPKKVKVPGLLSDEGLAAEVKTLVDTQKATGSFGPQTDSAVDFSRQLINMRTGLPNPIITTPGRQRAESRERAAQYASSTESAVNAIPGAPQLFGAIERAGTLTPEQGLEEQQRLTEEAREYETYLEDAKELRRKVEAGEVPPPVGYVPGEPAMRPLDAAAQRVDRAVADEKALQDAREAVALTEGTVPTQAWWLNAAQTGARTAAQMGTGALKYPIDVWELTTGQPTPEIGLWLDGVDKALTKMMPGDPARAKEFVTELSAGFGSMTAFMIAGYAGRAVGLPAGLVSGSLGAAVTGNQLYEEAESFGADATAKWLALIAGTGLGATEAIPIDRAFMRADVATGGLVRQLLVNTTATSIEEFTQELAQTAGEDLVAKFIYDHDREIDPVSWLRAGAVGAITGGAVGAVTTILQPGGERAEVEIAQIDDAQLEAAVDEAIDGAEQKFAAALGDEAADTDVAVPADGTAAVAAPQGEQAAVPQTEAARPRPVNRADPVMTLAGLDTQTETAVSREPETVQLDQQTSVQVAPQTNTPEFKNWFKQSKVVDEAGAPLRVYHGTDQNFRAFDAEADGIEGVFFSSSAAIASGYANPSWRESGEAQSVIPVYLALENPLIVDWQDAVRRSGGEGDSFDAELLNEIASEAQGKYDGLIIRGIRDGAGPDAGEIADTYIAFRPEQIKSAIGNRGTFDPNDPNIDRAVAPDIQQAVDLVQLEASETMPLPALEAGLTGPIPSVVKAARAYAEAAGIPHRRARSYVKVDTKRAARIAQAYTDMKHEPDDPAVQSAYKAMSEETLAQYQFVKATGIKIETILPGQPDPYPNGPRDVLKDIRENNHIWYFDTRDGFGSNEAFDPSDNPLLEATAEVSDNGKPMTVNDVFRVVHDFFGHGLEGSGFGARGEENAWQSHMRLYSASAVPAMTSETRGQNSWVNYGPFGEQNRANPRETTYADQKTGIMPSWTWSEGVEDSSAYDLDAPVEYMLAPQEGVQYERLQYQTRRFVDAITAAKAASPFGAAVHVYDIAHYEQMRVFLAPDSLSGFALNGEEIVSVFSHPNAGGGRLKKIIDTAVANGGRKLDAFDGKLVQMYAALGFKEVARSPWTPAFSPEGWNPDWGTPDVVFMEYVGDADEAVASYGTKEAAFEAWDDGAAIRDGEPGGEGELTLLYSGIGRREFRVATREMWLTPDRRTAEQFAQSGSGLAEFDEDGNNIGGSVFTFYARMENPLEVEWEGNDWASGPETEYPTIYRVTVDGDDVGVFSSESDAEEAKQEAVDRAADERREELEEATYIEPAAPLLGEPKFKVKLRDTSGAGLLIVADLHERVRELEAFEPKAYTAFFKRGPNGELLGQSSRANADEGYFEEQVTLEEATEQHEAELAEARSELEEATAGEETLGEFDTDTEAQDFLTDYIDEQATEAGDAVDVAIEEETDYEAEDAGQTTDSVVRQAKADGYDGVIFRDVDEGSGPVDVYVIIEPGNAKSTANLGTWNREDPDILRMTGTSSARMPYAYEPTRPQAGIPEQPYDEPSDVRLTRLAALLVKTLDITARHGRLTARDSKVMGEYNRRTAVTRLRTWTDLSTLAHEAGHAINDSMAQALDTFIGANLSTVNKIAKLYPGYDQIKGTPATVRREGFAEFFRLYTMTPQVARNRWPQFTADFEALLDREDPKVRVGLNAVGEGVEAWLQLPSTRLIENTVIDGRREQGINAAMKELKDKGFKTWMQEYARRSVTALVNRQAPLNKLVSELLNEGEANRGVAIDLTRADDPRTLIRLARNAGSRGMVQVVDGVLGYRSTQSMSRGLREAIMISQDVDPKTTPGALDEERLHSFSAYLVARRALDEYRRFEAGEIERPPVAYSKGDVIRAIRDFEKKYKSFVQAADIVHEYGMALWQKQYDAGLMTKETFEDGLQRQFYVPLQRDLSDKRAALGSSAVTTGGSGPLQSIVKRFRGSDRDIIDPLAVLMQKTFALEGLIAENEVKRTLAVLADRVGQAGALVERIPANQLTGATFSVREVVRQLTGLDDVSDADATDLVTLLGGSIEKGDSINLFRSQQSTANGEPIVYFWENGKVSAIQLKDGDLGMDVVNLLNGIGKENMDAPLELLASTSTVFRTAITSWPDFLMVNYIRDQFSAWILNDVGYKPFVSGAQGIAEEVRQKQWAKSYNAAGGIMGGMNVAAMHTAHVDRDIRALRSKGYIANVFGDVRSGWDFPNMIKGLGRISAVTETGTRLGLYRGYYERAKREGLNDYEASIEAAYGATDYIDFGLNGSKMLTSRRLIPFLNAQIQGFYKMVRTLGGDEVRQRRGLKFVLGAYFKNINNLPLSRVEKNALRTGRKAWLKMLSIGFISAALHFLFRDDPDYQEAGEYLRVTGWVIPMGDGRLFYLPKPFELAMAANAIERGLEFASGDSTAVGRFLRGVVFNMTPPTAPPAVQVALEASINKDFFTGREIVPSYMQALAPELQYDNYTSSLAKWMGNSFGWSPMMVDHVLGGLGASAYRDISTALNAADPTRASLDETDMPILRRFVRDTRRGSVSAQDFWNQASTRSGALARAAASYKREVDAGNEPAAERRLAQMDADQRSYAVLMTHFDADQKRLNPFYRATQATTLISKMRREVASELSLEDTTVADAQQSIQLTAGQKQQIDEILSELSRREVRNTLIATGQPGWAGKELLPTQETMDLLLTVNPDVYDELQRRWTKKKIYDAEAVYEFWPEARDRLVQDGQYAILDDLATVAGAGL
jgi:hypothetical protein